MRPLNACNFRAQVCPENLQQIRKALCMNVLRGMRLPTGWS